MGPAKNLPYILKEPTSLDLTNGLQRNFLRIVLSCFVSTQEIWSLRTNLFYHLAACIVRRQSVRVVRAPLSTNGTTAIHETTSGASFTLRRPGGGRCVTLALTHSLPGVAGSGIGGTCINKPLTQDTMSHISLSFFSLYPCDGKRQAARRRLQNFSEEDECLPTSTRSLAIAISRRLSNMCGATLPSSLLLKLQVQGDRPTDSRDSSHSRIMICGFCKCKTLLGRRSTPSDYFALLYSAANVITSPAELT